jgi:hypothetical protein
MTIRVPPFRSPLGHSLRSFRAAIALLALVPACAWDPWIPGERSWNPDIVVNPSELSDQLPLDTRHMGTLSCYTPLCEKRFRIVVETPGTLAVSMIPELASDDDRARLVLEGIQGVLGQADTGRGPRTDVPALGVSERVGPGVYFVLLESIGGPMPYQLTARVTPGEGPPPAPEPEPQQQPVEGPPPRLVEAPGIGNVRAGYDPAVSFATLRSFRFPAPRGEGDAGQVGAPLEDPLDRMIRRQLADELVRRGFHQASGSESADLVVDFSRGAINRDFYGIFSLYERYGFGVSSTGWAFGDRVQTRGTLAIDIVDTRSNRIAWHARTSEGLGPGITPGERAEALLREAITESMLGFPPR